MAVFLPVPPAAGTTNGNCHGLCLAYMKDGASGGTLRPFAPWRGWGFRRAVGGRVQEAGTQLSRSFAVPTLCGRSTMD